MQLHFFHINVVNVEEDTKILNDFLGSHKVTYLEKHFVSDAGNSFWSICVTTSDQRLAFNKAKKSRVSVDYKEILPQEEFIVFADLRSLRKQISESEGIPAYNVFTNEQLAEMVKRRVSSISELSKISGIGTARLEKYSEIFLKTLAKHLPIRTAS